MSDFAEFLEDPAWFPAEIDSEAGNIHYVRTREQIIRESAFLDGRTPIAVASESMPVPIDAALAWHVSGRETSSLAHLLAHVSFCGSTLLSRLLQGDRTVLVYREPHILAQLANLKVSRHDLAKDAQGWPDLIGFCLQQLSRTWNSEPALIKPSNWVNTLLADMLAATPDAKWGIIDTDIEDFLIANLRGGKARLAYSLNLLNQFLAANTTYRGDVLAVERAGLDPTQRLLRLLVVNFETQQALLQQASARSPASVQVTLADLQTDPGATVARVARGLGLPLTDSDIETAIERDMPRHAKDAASHYHPDREAAENARLRADLQADIDAALEWRQSILSAAA